LLGHDRKHHRSATNHCTGIWCSFLGEGAAKQESIEDAIKEQVDIVGFVLFHWGTARSTVCAKNESRVRVGSQEQMTQKREAFEELIGKVGQELKKTLAEEVILIQ